MIFCGEENFLSISVLNVIFFWGKLLIRSFPQIPFKNLHKIFMTNLDMKCAVFLQ